MYKYNHPKQKGKLLSKKTKHEPDVEFSLVMQYNMLKGNDSFTEIRSGREVGPSQLHQLPHSEEPQ